MQQVEPNKIQVCLNCLFCHSYFALAFPSPTLKHIQNCNTIATIPLPLPQAFVLARDCFQNYGTKTIGNAQCCALKISALRKLPSQHAVPRRWVIFDVVDLPWLPVGGQNIGHLFRQNWVAGFIPYSRFVW